LAVEGTSDKEKMSREYLREDNVRGEAVTGLESRHVDGLDLRMCVKGSSVLKKELCEVEMKKKR
jgi:hypothetical protein